MHRERSPIPAPAAYHRERVPVAVRIEALLDDLRRELERVRQHCGRTPHRVFTEICGRQAPRAMGMKTLATALIAAHEDGVSVEQLLPVAIAFEAWILAFEPVAPAVVEALRTETREEAEANVPQIDAAVHPSPANVARAREQTRDNIAASRRLLHALDAMELTRG